MKKYWISKINPKIKNENNKYYEFSDIIYNYNKIKEFPLKKYCRPS